ncbi:hypothetical protein AVEN_94242-1 [Araneus ventricosus]|uniref:Uncharacterized protein n=1 Tax=Araneus ventricosus TaxID=182803 RepID=A0A4Y2SB10_ARAVE|nr:hypothetical protein AVEN_94242-1 [Araneus ventricosus]
MVSQVIGRDSKKNLCIRVSQAIVTVQVESFVLVSQVIGHLIPRRICIRVSQAIVRDSKKNLYQSFSSYRQRRFQVESLHQSFIKLSIAIPSGKLPQEVLKLSVLIPKNHASEFLKVVDSKKNRCIKFSVIDSRFRRIAASSSSPVIGRDSGRIAASSFQVIGRDSRKNPLRFSSYRSRFRRIAASEGSQVFCRGRRISTSEFLNLSVAIPS